MLNVKALTTAFAITSGVAFCFFVAYALMVPEGFEPGPVWGSFVPDFRWISVGRFLLGLGGAVFAGALAGFLAAVLNNAFHRLWATSS